MSKQESSITNCMTMGVDETNVGEAIFEKVDCGDRNVLAIQSNSSSSSSTNATVTSTHEDILKNTSLTTTASTPQQKSLLSYKSTTINYISTTDTSDVINDSTDLSSSFVEPTHTSIKNNEDNDKIDSEVALKVENSVKETIILPTAPQEGVITPSKVNNDNHLRNRKFSTSGYNNNNVRSISDHNQVRITLLDDKLWEKFHNHVNEMIVTKDGRRMFPVLKIKIDGLEPSSMYTVTIDFTVSDSHRWKFMNGRWIRGNKEDNIKNSSTYMHCDSPNFGSFWMNNTISFAKLKISNKVSKDASKIQIHSLFRYLPCIHIYSIDSTTRGLTHIITKHFDNTEFVAVTAYQNDAITRLKVSYNPFAKAFLDVKRSGNDSPSTNYHSSTGNGSHCHNRDIYKPYDDNYYKTFNSLSTSASSSITNNSVNSGGSAIGSCNSSVSAFHKQLGNVTEENYSSSLANNVNPFLYQQSNLPQEPSNNVPQVMQHHLRPSCNSSTAASSNGNTNSSHNLTNELNNSGTSSVGMVNPTNLPHYYDYLQSTGENCAMGSRINSVESRNNPLLSFYDNNTSFKTPNYPYAYQYNCPNNYYYDKAYLPADNTNYFYAIKTENNSNQPQQISPSPHPNQSTNSCGGSIPNCNSNNNRHLANDNIHQYNYNYHNVTSFYNKDVKYHDKNTTKSSHPSQSNGRDDKRTD